VQTPEGMRDRFNIEVRVQCEVKRIIRDKKSVELKRHGITYAKSVTHSTSHATYYPGRAGYR